MKPLSFSKVVIFYTKADTIITARRSLHPGDQHLAEKQIFLSLDFWIRTITPFPGSSFSKLQVYLKTWLKLSTMQVGSPVVLILSYLAKFMLETQVARPSLLTAATQEKENRSRYYKNILLYLHLDKLPSCERLTYGTRMQTAYQRRFKNSLKIKSLQHSINERFGNREREAGPLRKSFSGWLVWGKTLFCMELIL